MFTRQQIHLSHQML